MSSPKLYRAKRVDGKGWMEGNVIEFDGLAYIIDKAIILSSQVAISGVDCGASICGFIQVIPETVGQAVGEKDKNGVEMWEDSIVRYWSAGGEASAIYKIVWNSYKMGFVLTQKGSGKAGKSIRDWFPARTEVIHDNPELLKESE